MRPVWTGSVDLSIIIVNWNTKALLANCLQTVADNLARITNLTAETLVVDNASTDGSLEMVRAEFPWVRLLANDQNLGFARANNRAYSQSDGRFILLLNPDTELLPGTIVELLDFMARHPQTGVSGARLLNPDGSLQQSCYRAPTIGRELWSLLHLDKIFPGYVTYNMTDWDVTSPRTVEVLKGACFLLRREAVGQDQLFDEAYFMYSEEVDLCHRIHKRGWTLHWVPMAEVVHHEGQSTKQAAGSMFIHLYQAKLLYFRKNSGPWTARFYKIVLLIAALVRLVVSPLAWLEPSPTRQRHLSLANRYWQLLRLLPGL